MTVEAINSNLSKPLPPQTLPPQTLPTQTLPPQTRFSRILLVEDDLAQLRTLTKIMEAEGFTVVGCQLAREALAQISQSSFGVVIIDLNLPDLPGVKLAEQTHEIDNRIQIIVHTGYGSFETAKALINIAVVGNGGSPDFSGAVFSIGTMNIGASVVDGDFNRPNPLGYAGMLVVAARRSGDGLCQQRARKKQNGE